MSTVLQLLQAIWQQDFHTLMNPHLVNILYGLLFTILLLENGLLPASFLPGDSLLFLTGALIEQGILNPILVFILLVSGAGAGYWLGFLQGRWLSHTRLMQQWMGHLPKESQQRVDRLFRHYGLAALILARFLAFVRTLMPIVAGLSQMDMLRFHIFNWLSALLWVTVICGGGYLFSSTAFFIKHKELMLLLLTLLPLSLLICGLLGLLVTLLRHRNINKKQ